MSTGTDASATSSAASDANASSQNESKQLPHQVRHQAPELGVAAALGLAVVEVALEPGFQGCHSLWPKPGLHLTCCLA